MVELQKPRKGRPPGSAPAVSLTEDKLNKELVETEIDLKNLAGRRVEAYAAYIAATKPQDQERFAATLAGIDGQVVDLKTHLGELTDRQAFIQSQRGAVLQKQREDALPNAAIQADVAAEKHRMSEDDVRTCALRLLFAASGWLDTRDQFMGAQAGANALRGKIGLEQLSAPIGVSWANILVHEDQHGNCITVQQALSDLVFTRSQTGRRISPFKRINAFITQIAGAGKNGKHQ